MIPKKDFQIHFKIYLIRTFKRKLKEYKFNVYFFLRSSNKIFLSSVTLIYYSSCSKQKNKKEKMKDEITTSQIFRCLINEITLNFLIQLCYEFFVKAHDIKFYNSTKFDIKIY